MGIISRSIIVFFCVAGLPLSLSAANGELTFAGNGTVTLGNNAELKVGDDLKVGLFKTRKRALHRMVQGRGRPRHSDGVA